MWPAMQMWLPKHLEECYERMFQSRKAFLEVYSRNVQFLVWADSDKPQYAEPARTTTDAISAHEEISLNTLGKSALIAAESTAKAVAIASQHTAFPSQPPPEPMLTTNSACPRCYCKAPDGAHTSDHTKQGASPDGRLEIGVV